MCQAVVLAGGVLVPAAATAQGDPYARVSVSTAQLYDDNLFGTVSDDRQSDVVFRLGPAIETGYLSVPLEIAGHYAFDAERYVNRASLSTRLARQAAGFTLRHNPTRRVTLGFRTSYLRTQTPHELNLESGLAAARAPARRLTAGPSVQYEWTPRTKVSADYEFARDALAGGIAAEVHRARVGVVRRTRPRNTRWIDYRFRSFGFGHLDARASHIVAVGWEREITRVTSVEVALGPRLSEGALRPEVSAVLRSRFRQVDFSGGYSRTEVTAIGESGALDVQRVALAATYHRARNLAVTTTAAVFSVGRAAGRASIYAFDVEAIRQLARNLTLVASGRFSLQRGTLAGERADIPHRTLSLKLTATLPRLSRIPPGQPR